MLTSRTQSLDILLVKGKSDTDKVGLGCLGDTCSSSFKTVFVQALGDTKSNMIRATQQKHNVKKRWICHFCGRPGHIRPF